MTLQGERVSKNFASLRLIKNLFLGCAARQYGRLIYCLRESEVSFIIRSFPLMHEMRIFVYSCLHIEDDCVYKPKTHTPDSEH